MPQDSSSVKSVFDVVVGENTNHREASKIATAFRPWIQEGIRFRVDCTRSKRCKISRHELHSLSKMVADAPKRNSCEKSNRRGRYFLIKPCPRAKAHGKNAIHSLHRPRQVFRPDANFLPVVGVFNNH
jgi:hypothetical protein